jgi:hypothetical protein
MPVWLPPSWEAPFWRWLHEDAIRPWYHRCWIFPRAPAFAASDYPRAFPRHLDAAPWASIGLFAEIRSTWCLPDAIARRNVRAYTLLSTSTSKTGASLGFGRPQSGCQTASELKCKTAANRFALDFDVWRFARRTTGTA